jgi:hypothetical protein
VKYWRCDSWVENKLHIAFGTHRSSKLGVIPHRQHFSRLATLRLSER